MLDSSSLFAVVRSGTLDLKTLRRYRYDSLCRLCEKEDETVDHIVNRCMELDRRTNITDVNSILREDIQEVVGRVKAFVTRIDEMEGWAKKIRLFFQNWGKVSTSWL